MLSIPPTQDVTFERFSDSVGAYTILEPDNASGFKTLVRAAKAKLKLRLRVTYVSEVTEEAPQPSAESPTSPTDAKDQDKEKVVSECEPEKPATAAVVPPLPTQQLSFHPPAFLPAITAVPAQVAEPTTANACAPLVDASSPSIPSSTTRDSKLMYWIFCI